MAVFEYVCGGCGAVTEAAGQTGKPPAPPPCPACGGQTRRAFITLPGFIVRPWGYNLPPGHPDYFKFDEDRLEDEHRQYVKKQRRRLKLDTLVSYGPGPLKPAAREGDSGIS